MPYNSSCRGTRRTPGGAWSCLTADVDVINSRYGRTRTGYGPRGDPAGYVRAKIAYGCIPALEDFQWDAAG